MRFIALGQHHVGQFQMIETIGLLALLAVEMRMQVFVVLMVVAVT